MSKQYNLWKHEYEIRDKYLKNNKLQYYEYLNKFHWTAVSEQMKRLKLECFRCHTSSNLQVHHITYVNMGDEKMDDLMVLCKECHKLAHTLAPGELKPETPDERLLLIINRDDDNGYDYQSLYWLFSRAFYYAVKKRRNGSDNFATLLQKYEALSMKFDDLGKDDLSGMETLREELTTLSRAERGCCK